MLIFWATSKIWTQTLDPDPENLDPEKSGLWKFWTMKNAENNWMGGMFTRIPGNVIILTFRRMFQRIPGNVSEDSRECFRRFREYSRGFRGIFQKIPENVRKDSGECSKRLRGMFEEIPGNVQEDSGECSRGFRECWRRFRGMLAKILENTQKYWTLYNAIKRK